MKRPFWNTERRVAFSLFVIALLLYVPGLWWGLPYGTSPERIHPWGTDELAPLGPIAELYSVFTHAAQFNPQYPLFHYIMEALAVGPYMAFLWLTGDLSQPSTAYPYGLADPVTALATMTILARLVNLLMAAGVTVIACRTATILWDRRTGILAGVLVLLSYPMFYYARTSNVDMGALFWTALGLMVFAACLRDTLTVRRAAWLGTFAALATATKDASYAAFLPLALVLLPYHLRQHRGRSDWKQTWKAPLTALLAGTGVYLVASGLLLHPERFMGHVQFITEGSPQGRGLFYYGAPPTLAGYLQVTGVTALHLVDALGAPMAACVLAGLGLCALRDPKTLAFTVPALGILLGVILPVRFVLLRFVLIMAYVFAFFAAYALASALRARHPLVRRAAPLVLVVTCGWALLRGADLTYQMINDARYDMAAWFRSHAVPGDRVGYYGSFIKLPPLDAGIVTTPMPGQLAAPATPASPDVAPEFVVVIPQQHNEPVHEWTLPEEGYQALRDGSMGYEQVLGIQTGSLFSRRPVSFVNPPVKVFVREDHLATLREVQPRIEVDH